MCQTLDSATPVMSNLSTVRRHYIPATGHFTTYLYTGGESRKSATAYNANYPHTGRELRRPVFYHERNYCPRHTGRNHDDHERVTLIK